MSPRWQRAKKDWRGFRGTREVIVALVGGGVGATALLAAGFGHDAAVAGITVGSFALAASVIAPGVELLLCWFQVPMRQLREEVEAISARLDATPPQTLRQPGSDRAGCAREGRTLRVTIPATSSQKEILDWVNTIDSLLGEHGYDDDSAGFSQAHAELDLLLTLEARIAALARPLAALRRRD